MMSMISKNLGVGGIMDFVSFLLFCGCDKWREDETGYHTLEHFSFSVGFSFLKFSFLILMIE